MVRTPAVLIVDDEAICLTLTGKLLENLGVRVFCAKDGQEAIRIFQEHADEIAFVLMDIQMPEMDGVSAFKIMRAIQPDVQVVFISGYVNKVHRSELSTMKPAGFIKKPPTLSELSGYLKKATEKMARNGKLRSV